MTGPGWGYKPAYLEFVHSKVTSYAGSHYSPTPIVILSKHFRTNVRKCAPKDPLFLGMFSLKNFLFNVSPQCREAQADACARSSPRRGMLFQGKSPGKGDPSASFVASLLISLRMTGTSGGYEPAYPVTGHSKAPAYAGSHYSPTPMSS